MCEKYFTLSPADVVAEYVYDVIGRRLQKNVNGTITNFFWEGDTVGLELDANNQPIRKYITGAGMDDYEGHVEYSEVTDWSKIFDDYNHQAWYSYMRDQVGTIYQVYDHKNRTIAETRTYDTFGNLLSQTGTSRINLGFQGKYHDPESGLCYFYHRYYSPLLGRFLTEDPIGFDGGINLYNVTDHDLINYVDPFGLEKRCSAQGSTLEDIEYRVERFERDGISPRIKGIGISIFKWKVWIGIFGVFKCRYVCKDECGKEYKIERGLTKRIGDTVLYFTGPGYKFGKIGWFLRLTDQRSEEQFLEDYFQRKANKEAKKDSSNYGSQNAHSICDSILNS